VLLVDKPSSRKMLRKGRGRIGQSLWSSYGPVIVSRGAKTVPLQIDLFLFNSETNILADGKGGLSVALKIVVQIAAIKAVGPSLQRANDCASDGSDSEMSGNDLTVLDRTSPGLSPALPSGRGKQTWRVQKKCVLR
jgi:hypothetical protein